MRSRACPKHSTVDFVDLGGRTNLVSTTRYDSLEALEQVIAMGMAEGYAQTLERLAELLATDHAAGA